MHPACGNGIIENGDEYLLKQACYIELWTYLDSFLEEAWVVSRASTNKCQTFAALGNTGQVGYRRDEYNVVILFRLFLEFSDFGTSRTCGTFCIQESYYEPQFLEV